MDSTSLRPPLSQIIIYAIGQLGWSLASFGAANLLVYFYMPPETGDTALFPGFIYQGAILGVVTVIGLASFSGRLFDGITDPLIAAYSDRTSSKNGKRRKWMAWSSIPFAIFSFLIFFPAQTSSELFNSVYLFACLFLFYGFMTAYVIPYTALIGELGHHPADRMKISTVISITWAVGFVIGGNAYALQSLFEHFYSAVVSFQLAVACFSILALVCMWVPVFFLKETRFAKQSIVTLNVRSSIKQVIRNKDFRLFAVADWLFWIALSFIQLGVSYYLTLLLGVEVERSSLFLTIAFLASFLMYYPVNLVVKRWGKKQIMLAGFLIFSLSYLITANLDVIPLPADVLFYTLALLSSIPMAIFGIIPNALIADLIYKDEKETGEQLTGMYYAARNFTSKLGIAFANLLFPSLLLLGKSLENPVGIRVSAWLALAFCLFGYFLFRSYKGESDR